MGLVVNNCTRCGHAAASRAFTRFHAQFHANSPADLLLAAPHRWPWQRFVTWRAEASTTPDHTDAVTLRPCRSGPPHRRPAT
ncbi:hypothetical protein FF096_04790 [Micromonospora sp. CP22]|nr:hypothetical protein [Micromonospora sp. CP22]